MDELFLALTAADVEHDLAKRLRAERRRRKWSQAELATRSGLSVATVARLERSGQGQVASLTRLCAAFGRLADFDALLKAPIPATLDELRRQVR